MAKKHLPNGQTRFPLTAIVFFLLVSTLNCQTRDSFIEKVANPLPNEPITQTNVPLATNDLNGINHTLIYNQDYPVSSVGVLYNVPNDLLPDEYLFLKVRGLGEVSISLNNNSGLPNSFQFKQISIESLASDVLVPFDSSLFKANQSIIVLKSEIAFGEITAVFTKEKSFDFSFNKSIKVFSFFASKFRFIVKVESILKHEDNNRIQFILQSSLESQILQGQEELELLINSLNDFPDKNSYQTRASGFLGSGLIKTIPRQHQLYCIDQNCSFHCSIYTKDVDFFTFFPTILPNGSEIKLSHTLTLLEETEVGEQVEYVLFVPEVEDHWVFTITPLEGNVQVYINPDKKEQKLTDYKYRANSRRKEEIVITSFEAKSYKFKGDKFYLAFKSMDESMPATFKFEVRRIPVHMPILIKENYAESGVVAHSETISYVLDLKSMISETLTVEFRLESYHGSADLYVKECLLEEPVCEITKSEIESPPSGRIFRSSKALRNGQLNKNDFVVLHFNCIGFDFGNENTLNNKHPISQSCRFAVGVNNVDSTNNYGTFYKLITYGSGLVNEIVSGKVTLIKLYTKERIRYRIFVGSTVDDFSNVSLFLKFTVVTGKCSVYFSETNQSPTAANNDLSVDLENDNFSSVHSKTFISQFRFKSNAASDISELRYLYMSVESAEYSVFELDSRWSETEINDASTEEITDKAIIHRQITSTSNTVKDQNLTAFIRKFILHLQDKGQTHANSSVKINLNAQHFGLNLCVKVLNKSKTQTPNDSCDFSSVSEQLIISKGDAKMIDATDLVVEVHKKFDPAKELPHFPIEFVLKVDDTDNYEHIELLHPGLSMVNSLNPGISQDFIIDLIPISRNLALFFNTADPEMTVQIAVANSDTRDYVMALNSKISGLKINQISQFREQRCQTKCKLMISVYTTSPQMHRYTLTYTVDDSPIILKEGDQLTLPNNIPLWFLFESGTQNPVSFSVHNEAVESVISAKMLGHYEKIEKSDVFDKLLSMSFDFKSNIERDPQIMIPLSFLANYPDHKVLFLIRPVMKFEEPNPQQMLESFGPKKTLNVHLHSRVLHLTPFYQTKSSVLANEFAYFYFNVDALSDFSVILTLNVGEAILFLSKEPGSLPTQNRFWKKGSNSKGDEIVINKEMFADEKEPIRQFTVGVYGKENAQFKLLYMPDFKNLIKVKFQQLNDIPLEVNKNYYFAYTNIKDKYSTLLYSEGSDVEVSALNYEDSDSNFVEMVTGETNYLEKFVFKKGDLPRKKHFENVAYKNSHTIVRIKALEGNCRMNFAIYDDKLPIEVSADRTFSFTQNKDESNTFVTNFDNSYEEMEIHFTLEFGTVELQYSNKLNTLSHGVTLSIPSQKLFNFKVENLQKANDIMIFKQLFIEVKSTEFSRFSVLIKPKDKFLEIKPFEPQIIHSSAENDLFVFYTLSQKGLKHVTSILVDFQCPESFRERPELLFISDSDVVLNPSSPFIPMPINDLYERVSGGFLHLEIRLEPQTGSYVFKILKSDTPHSSKISISLNNQQNIGPNGIYHGSVPKTPGSTHQYSMFLSSPGEFRIAFESCQDLDIESALFYGDPNYYVDRRDFNFYGYDKEEKASVIQFNKRFKQPANYLSVNKNSFHSKKSMETILLNVKRGFVNFAGLLRFNLTNKSASDKYADQPNKSYVLWTEFRPLSKELILKDYIKLASEDDIDQFTPDTKFTDKGLSIRVRIPSFIPQLVIDYPHLTTVVVKLHAYLFSDPTFEAKFKDCGLDCLGSIPHTIITQTVELKKTQFEDTLSVLHDWIKFTKQDFEIVQNAPKINVFCMASVHFYNNLDELNQISKNNKFTSVPYFFITMPNENRSFFAAHYGILVLFCLTLGFLVVVYAKMRKGQEQASAIFETSSHAYTRPSSRMEMSAVSIGSDDNLAN